MTHDDDLPTSPATPATNDAWLDALLTRGGAHLDDAGFTDRVIAALPPPRRRFSARDFAVGAGALGAAAVGALAYAGGSGALFGAAPLQIGALVVVVALAMWGALASADA